MSGRMQPFDFAAAHAAAGRMTTEQHRLETAFKRASADLAEAEKKYRLALAKEIVRQHAEDGVAWSVAPDLARGERRVAQLRYERDVGVGVRDASQQALWRLAADRRDLGRFIEWSMRVDVAVHVYGDSDPADHDERAIGARS